MTLEEFSEAAWCASDQLMITPEEAKTGIEKYRLELESAARTIQAAKMSNRSFGHHALLELW